MSITLETDTDAVMEIFDRARQFEMGTAPAKPRRWWQFWR